MLEREKSAWYNSAPKSKQSAKTLTQNTLDQISSAPSSRLLFMCEVAILRAPRQIVLQPAIVQAKEEGVGKGEPPLDAKNFPAILAHTEGISQRDHKNHKNNPLEDSARTLREQSITRLIYKSY